jgi:hypothetical protein
MAILLHRVTVINMKIILVVALILCKNRSIVFVLPMLCLVCFFFRAARPKIVFWYVTSHQNRCETC